MFSFCNCPYCSLSAKVDIHSICLACIHFGVGLAVSQHSTFADLGIDTSRNDECHLDIVVLQIKRLEKAEQSPFGGTICRSEGKSEESGNGGIDTDVSTFGRLEHGSHFFVI